TIGRLPGYSGFGAGYARFPPPSQLKLLRHRHIHIVEVVGTRQPRSCLHFKAGILLEQNRRGLQPSTSQRASQNNSPIVFFVIFVLLYMVFHSVAESAVLIFPTIHSLTGGLILQKLLGYNFSLAVWVGYIALFGIAVDGRRHGCLFARGGRSKTR